MNFDSQEDERLAAHIRCAVIGLNSCIVAARTAGLKVAMAPERNTVKLERIWRDLPPLEYTK